MQIESYIPKTILASAVSALLLGASPSSSIAANNLKNRKSDVNIYNISGKTNEDHLYLEEVLGEKALAEVQAWNKKSLKRLTSDPRYAQMEADALNILNSKDKIAYVSYRGGEAHNFWQDAEHIRGIWRKTTLESYLSKTTQWETILDFDALAKSENKNWVYQGNDCLAPDYKICMVSLSDGGKDANIQREFNIDTKNWVKNGFETPESKGGSSWLNQNTQILGIDFGEGSMTKSGYPMIAKIWKRGQKIQDAQEFMRGEPGDVGLFAGTLVRSDDSREIIVTRARTFYESDSYWVPRNGDILQEAVKIPIPAKSSLGSEFKGQILLSLNEDWRGYKNGDLISFSFDSFMDKRKIDDIHLVYSPDQKSSLNGYGVTKSKVLMSISRDVKSAAYAFDWDGHAWSSKQLNFPINGTISIGATNNKEDIAFINSQSFLEPSTLWTYDSASSVKTKAKALPDWFDASEMSADQFFATSKDGTKIPYFVVRKKGLKMDGSNPTLLYGYGGFEVSLNPSYSATRGKLWLENGGIYVLANIRGGGEYGPKWHQAGLKTNRQIIYDDFISIAEDLIAKKLTAPKHLGIEGGSNGGLLMGVMFTQRPDLFNAVICAVPLLDMLRYDKLLAGASWVGEYGNPSIPEERAFLQKISPYHNINSKTQYPEVFFVTSTKDDRVHPAHARKTAKRFEDQGHDFLYYENIDGGHSAAANLEETAKRLALQHVYLMQKLKDNK